MDDPWESLELQGDDKNKDEAEQARLEVKRRFRNVFTTGDGEWVLNYLNAKYFNSPVVDENAVNVLAKAGIREGELRLLRYIHLMIAPER